MLKATDVIMRHLAMLRLIPTHPHSMTTRQLGDKLRALNDEYDVSARTIQRSLEHLSGRFPISCELRGRAHHWFWTDPDALVQIPSMSASTAFALKMAKDHLQPIMPSSTLALLDAYFKHAEQVLAGTALGDWPERSAVIAPGPRLEAPSVQVAVQDAVYTGLLENRRINVTYQSRGEGRERAFELHPLGIVVRAGILYLVATAWNYEDVRQYALHRMSKALAMDEPAQRPPDFDLIHYIQEASGFSYPVSDANLHLRALFDEGAVLHLRESRLGTDQCLTTQDDGRVLLEVTVKDNADLRWWLLGFGSGVGVLAPQLLRDEIWQEVRRMSDVYR